MVEGEEENPDVRVTPLSRDHVLPEPPWYRCQPMAVSDCGRMVTCSISVTRIEESGPTVPGDPDLRAGDRFDVTVMTDLTHLN